jgi:hypothetical protein
VFLFGHPNFRECSTGPLAGSYNTSQFIQVECEGVDQIFVAEALLEEARM